MSAPITHAMVPAGLGTRMRARAEGRQSPSRKLPGGHCLTACSTGWNTPV